MATDFNEVTNFIYDHYKGESIKNKEYYKNIYLMVLKDGGTHTAYFKENLKDMLVHYSLVDLIKSITSLYTDLVKKMEDGSLSEDTARILIENSQRFYNNFKEQAKVVLSPEFVSDENISMAILEYAQKNKGEICEIKDRKLTTTGGSTLYFNPDTIKYIEAHSVNIEVVKKSFDNIIISLDELFRELQKL